MLQWGRGLATAEGMMRRRDKQNSPWLQWGRGLATAEGTIRRLAWLKSCCFNGAAVSRPRKAAAGGGAGGTALLLQWGRGLATAEGPRL